MTATLMIQGCTSDAGKSTVVAGLCRLFAQKGVQVAPFKPQNMALNSAVTADGGEIGRAQALQALAAGVEPSVHMNPVLLKPNSDTRAQVIVQGKSIGNLNAQNTHQLKPQMRQAVLNSYQKLAHTYQAILVEGAGSPAEINLRKGDIANMGFAEAVDCPVILVADIDKGGVFAHLIGTLACLSASEQHRIKGFIINRFRGDLALLQDGLDWLEAKTGKPVLGVLPYLHGLHLDAEDAIHAEHPAQANQPVQHFKVIAPLLPHISNHTDLDPLIQHPEIDFQWVKHQQAIPPADLIILPGSKNIAFDLQWLKQQGWQNALQKHLRYGGKVIGICGGLQMLGKQILDPHQIESAHTIIEGLGLLPHTTELQPNKTLKQVQGTLNLSNTPKVKGYEIHHGKSQFPHSLTPACWIEDQPEGIISEDNQLLATYLHGLFDTPEALQAILEWAGLGKSAFFDLAEHRETQLNWLAQALEKHCQIEAVLNLMNGHSPNRQMI